MLSPGFFSLGYCTHATGAARAPQQASVSRETPLARICSGDHNILPLPGPMTGICEAQGVENFSSFFSRQGNATGQTAKYTSGLALSPVDQAKSRLYERPHPSPAPFLSLFCMILQSTSPPECIFSKLPAPESCLRLCLWGPLEIKRYIMCF